MTNDMEILVTGGSGILGSKVAERLRLAGIEPCVLSRGDRPGTVRGNLLTGEGLEAAVRGADTIVHCASSPFRKARRTDVGGRSACWRALQWPASRTSSTSPSSA